MGWIEMIPAIAQVGGSLLAAGKRAGPDSQALGISSDVYQQALKLLMQQGYSPQQAQEKMAGPSAMGGVQADPDAVAAQKQALAELQRASHEGYGIEDQAAVNAMMNDVDQRTRGAREAAMGGLQPGSGASIAARLSSQQAGANQANNRALGLAAQSRRRALEALAGYSQLGSQMRNQSFGEGAQKAKAADAISEFNARNGTQNNQFNAQQGNNMQIAGQNAKVGALNALRGAGQDYSSGLYGAGQRTADQTMGTANAIGGGISAGANGVKDSLNNNDTTLKSIKNEDDDLDLINENDDD